jgi:hypothetical protein
MLQKAVFILCLGLTFVSARAQNNIADTSGTAVIYKAGDIYNQFIEKQSRLYNGIEHLGYLYTIKGYAYHGDMQDLKLNSRAVILDYEGLQLKREFYSPVYKTEEQAFNRLPDFRNVLYWAPDIETDTAGHADVEFYTSDIKGKYVAVLQGIDDQGHAGSYYFTFNVTDK